MDPLVRNNVAVSGRESGRAMIFAHGFGGNRESWRHVAPAFEPDHRVVVFDYVGAGGSDVTAYDRARYDSLHGYADDVIEIAERLGVTDAIFVGHSVSGMVGVLAANRRPDLIGALVLMGPSARYLDADGYVGGFTAKAVDALLDDLESDYLSYSPSLAPVLMGYPDRPELSDGLVESMASADPRIAAHFARVTFLSDNRWDLPDVRVPTLILQSVEDNIASPPVGAYVHEHIPGSRFITTGARGHVPHLSDPDEIVRHIRDFVG